MVSLASTRTDLYLAKSDAFGFDLSQRLAAIQHPLMEPPPGCLPRSPLHNTMVSAL